MQKLEDGEMLTTAEVETLAGALEAATQAEEAAEAVQQKEAAAPTEKKPLTPVEAIVRVAQGKVGNENEKLNIDNTANRNYTENINSNEQGGAPNDSDRVDRGMVEGVSGGQNIGGERTEDGRYGRGYQGLSRRDLTQGAYSLPIKKQTTPKGVVCCGGRYKTRTCDLPHVKRMRYQLRQSSNSLTACLYYLRKRKMSIPFLIFLPLQN